MTALVVDTVGWFCPKHFSGWYDGMCERAAAAESYNEIDGMWRDCEEPILMRLVPVPEDRGSRGSGFNSRGDEYGGPVRLRQGERGVDPAIGVQPEESPSHSVGGDT